MTRRLVSTPIRNEGGPVLGGSGTELRTYTDAALTTLATLYPESTGAATISNPVHPNSGWQTTLTGAVNIGDTVLNVTDSSGFLVGDLLAIYDGTHTEYKSITAVGVGTVTISSGVANAYATGPTLIGNPDMQGNVFFWLDQAQDYFFQLKDVGSSRVMPPGVFPVQVPTTALIVDQGGTLVGTRGTLNFQSGATVTDNAGANRVDVTINATPDIFTYDDEALLDF